MKNLRLHYFLTDFSVGTILIWLPIYCRASIGFTETEIGTLYLIGGIVSIIGSLINGYLAQKISDERKILNFGLISLILGAIVLSSAKTFIVIALGFMLVFYLKNILYVIGDEITISYLQSQGEDDFGKIRSFGSLGWGANFLLNGTLFAVDQRLIFVSLLIASVTLLINSFFLPHVKRSAELKYEFKDTKKLFKYKNYLLFVLATGLMWSAVNNMQAFVQYDLQDLGGSLQIFAYINTSIVLFDMLIMRYSSQILEKIGSRNYFFLYMTILFTKYLILLSFDSPMMIYAAVLFDPFFFGMMIPFSSLFIKNEIPRNLSTIALMLMHVFDVLLVSIFAQIDGIIYHFFGGDMVYTIMITTTIIVIFLGTKIKFPVKKQKEF